LCNCAGIFRFKSSTFFSCPYEQRHLAFLWTVVSKWAVPLSLARHTNLDEPVTLLPRQVANRWSIEARNVLEKMYLKIDFVASLPWDVGEPCLNHILTPRAYKIEERPDYHVNV